MKQGVLTIYLRDSMQSEDGWGHEEGRMLFERLLKIVENHPSVSVFKISLKGVRRTDASFPREGVMELARRFRTKKGFCLIDAEDEDLLANWDAAAGKRQQPMLVWSRRGYELLGPEPSEGLKQIFNLMIISPGLTTSEAASTCKVSVPNASNKLKALWENGYVLRHERVAPTGGVEFEYVVPK